MNRGLKEGSLKPPHLKRAPDIPRLLEVLERHGVRYVLIGSVAALLHSIEVDRTGDLDITPASRRFYYDGQFIPLALRQL